MVDARAWVVVAGAVVVLVPDLSEATDVVVVAGAVVN